ncbi:MAG: inositol-3-phosphate synthase [Planctomycetota bacterium]|nr:inositol-3-phosphate synthase [Planctomycetota bacterium]
MSKTNSRTGVWIIGALGSVATTIVVGCEAIRRGIAGTAGLVTETSPLKEIGLVEVGDLVFGGHEIREGGLLESAREIARNARSIPESLISAVAAPLEEISKEIRTGTALHCGESIQKLWAGAPEAPVRPVEAAERLGAEIEAFGKRNGCSRVIVLNLASTEPAVEPNEVYDDLEGFRKALEDPESSLPASVIYAYAAIQGGHPYINFTPSLGASIPARIQVADARGVPHMGRDGKTGETLVKSVLAPMFKARNLKVLSWVGYNILGNRDGEVLSNGPNNLAKVRDKDDALRRILGEDGLHTSVRIDYVPSLDDWKTAWDFVHFEGFLGTKMSMQFTWQGCDSMLAAPLALDLIRLTDLASRRGEGGLLGHLASFFKTPTGVSEPAYYRQFDLLLEYARSALKDMSTPRKAPSR